jgi:hypothetical protein
MRPPTAKMTPRRWSLWLVAMAAGALVAWQVADRIKAQGHDVAARLQAIDVSQVRYSVSPIHPRILLNHTATLSRLKQRLQSRNAAALRFRDLVDAQMAGSDAYAFQPWFAALMFRLTDDPLYATYAIMQTDAAVAAEEALFAQSLPAKVARDSYLEVGETIGNLALVYDWCHERLTPAQRARWLNYANQSVWNVWNPKKARWGEKGYAWTGWSVDNPSNNYYYSFLRATMLLGLASHGETEQAQSWLDTFRVAKLEHQLFPAFNRDLGGGGSREGTGYGTAMRNLYQLFDWWERSTGERLADRSPHTLASMAHLMHSTVPTLDRLAPTGDHARESSAALFDYHRDYLLELVALFPQERLSGIAKTYLEASSVKTMQHGFNAYIDFLYGEPEVQARPLADLATTYWGAGTGQLMMRSTWARDAVFANFICGPFTESHAHRDQGSFVIYRNGWLADDANTHSHSGIEQGEELHNLVRFEVAGVTVKQSNGPGCALTALADNPLFSFASARITSAYQKRAVVKRIERDFLFIKPDTFVVFDRTATMTGLHRIWTLNLPGTPTVDGDHLRSGSGSDRLDVHRLSPPGLKSEVIRWPTVGREMQGGFRVDVGDSGATGAPFLNVIGTAGSVASAVRSDANDQIGAQITLADGREALVRFGVDSLTATLVLKTKDRTALFEGALPSTVQPPPLYAKAPSP